MSDERNPDSGLHRYIMRQRIMAIGEDFEIKDQLGQPIYKIDGRARLVKEDLMFRDLAGNELYHIKERVIGPRETFNIFKGRKQVARIQDRIADPVRERFPIEIMGGQHMEAAGKVLWAEYNIRRGSQAVARISKRFSWISRDQYVVDISPGQDDCLILAFSVAIDMMAHKGR